MGLEWLDPPFIGGHWVPEMIEIAGGKPALGLPKEPSRQVTWNEIIESDPDVIVMMVCGFDLHKTVSEFNLLKNSEFWKKYSGKLFAVDGSAYFSRPGPRILDGVEILGEIIHPEIFDKKTAEGAWQRIN